jgi:threonine dehydratase
MRCADYCHHCSSGNHAAALALAAKLRGIPAFIVVPKNAPKCKLEAVKEYGGGCRLSAHRGTASMVPVWHTDKPGIAVLAVI